MSHMREIDSRFSRDVVELQDRRSRSPQSVHGCAPQVREQESSCDGSTHVASSTDQELLEMKCGALL